MKYKVEKSNKYAKVGMKKVIEINIPASEKTAEELKDVKYPDCVEPCALVKILGLTECETVSFCQWKFEKDETNCPVV